MKGKYFLAVIILIVIAGIIYWQLLSKKDIIKATFNCKEDKFITAEFSKEKVNLVLSDGRNVELPQALSASGARYANANESFVFWNKGDTAFIEENNKMTFTDCLQTAGN